MTFTRDTKLLQRVRTLDDKSGSKRLNEQAAPSKDKITQAQTQTLWKKILTV